MRVISRILLPSLLILLLSACQLFQTLEPSKQSQSPSAQENLSFAIGNFYDLQSGTLLQNYTLTLYQDSIPLDQWNISLRDNWRSNPAQSLADIHISFTLPPPSTSGEIAQGLINLKAAKANTTRYIQLNSANFSGKDGHVLDDALAKWSNQWFILPAEVLVGSGFDWVFNLPPIFSSIDRNTITTTSYFSIQSVQNVQTDDEQASLYQVSLNTNNIIAMLTANADRNSLLADDLENIIKFLNASQFTGTLLIGNTSHQLKKVEGELVITSATSPNQTLNLKIKIELINNNQNPPVAIPTQALQLPSELSDPNNVLQ